MGKIGLLDLERNFLKKVIECSPVQFDKKRKIYIPQPTRFWIRDKQLKKEISKLEEKGWIQIWEDIITQNNHIFYIFIELHKKEIQIRQFIIKNKKLPPYVRSKLLTTGIGGIKDFDKKPFKIKCLHLWTGYHIGDSRFRNPLGEFVIKEIKRRHQNR